MFNQVLITCLLGIAIAASSHALSLMSQIDGVFAVNTKTQSPIVGQEKPKTDDIYQSVECVEEENGCSDACDMGRN